MSALYIVRGIPGSGKSTLAKKLGISHHYEADMYFDLFNGGTFDAKLLPCAHKWCLNVARAALEQGYDVVVSNTFIKQWEIEPYRKLAQEIGNVDVIEIIVDKSPFKSVHNVPDNVVERMKLQFEYK